MRLTEEEMARLLTRPGYRVIDTQAPGSPVAPSRTEEVSEDGPLAADAPEGLLLARVRGLATRYGWECYHTYRSTKSEPGFPDVVLTDGTSLLMHELKSNTGKATEEQARWLSLLVHTGKVECGIWRPCHLSAITARLARRSTP